MRILPPITAQNAAQTPQNIAGQRPHGRFDAPRTAGTMPVWQGSNNFAAHLNAEADTPRIAATPKSDAPKFSDLIDIINPLHHIPVVGHLYRHITGDEISPASRFIGGAVFGGFIGAGGAMANLAFNDIRQTRQAALHDTQPLPEIGPIRTYSYGEMTRTAGSLSTLVRAQQA